MRRMRVSLLILAAVGVAMLLQGCYEERHMVVMRGELIPMTQQDVVQMVQDGAPNSAIIREIRESGTVFRLSANDVESLKNEGVSEEVLNFMLATREASPSVVHRAVVVERPTVVIRDPWWGWDYGYAPGYYSYPSHFGLSFSYSHFGGYRRHYGRYGYGIHYSRWR